jgi:hypothetical protein
MSISAINQTDLVNTEFANQPKPIDIIARLPKDLGVKIFSYMRACDNRFSNCDQASKSWSLLVRSDELWAISQAAKFMLKPTEKNRSFVYDRGITSPDEVLNKMESWISSIELNQSLEVNFYSDLSREKKAVHWTCQYVSDKSNIEHIKKQFLLLQEEPASSIPLKCISRFGSSAYSGNKQIYNSNFELFANADTGAWDSSLYLKALKKMNEQSYVASTAWTAQKKKTDRQKLEMAGVIFLVAGTAISLYMEALNKGDSSKYKMLSVITVVIMGGCSVLDRRSEDPIFQKYSVVLLAVLAIFAAQKWKSSFSS